MRQTEGGNCRLHQANDDLKGTAVYGTPGEGNSFSIRYDDTPFDVIIFATGNHKYYMAMTKEQIGGPFTNQCYSYSRRYHHKISPGDENWIASSAAMYNRCSGEDPWLSMGDHGTNTMLYGENNWSSCGFWTNWNRDEGGLQVFILTSGSYEECIEQGGIGEFVNGVYTLNLE